jgi:AhpD family alkylhydroperoxidase
VTSALTPALIRVAVRRSLRRVRHVMPVLPRHATGLVADVYRQVEDDFGLLAPPMALHSPNPPLLAASWTMLRESLLAPGKVGRGTKERVAIAVSESNACPYCVEVHGATVRGLTDGHRQPGAVVDPDAVTEWAHGIGDRRPPCPPEHAAEVVGVAVTFHYLNRMVNLFLDDSPLPARVPGRVRHQAHRALGRLTAATNPPPGASLALLPEAPTGENLWWAHGNHTIATAFTRAMAAVDAAAAEVVSPSVRDVVLTRLSHWDGRSPGVSRTWVENAVAGLPTVERPAGRLAMLTAIASYQVDAKVIADYRRDHPGDRALLGLTSWASMAAARRLVEGSVADGPRRSTSDSSR